MKLLRPSPKNTRGREMLLLVWFGKSGCGSCTIGSEEMEGTGCSLEDVEGAQQLAAVITDLQLKLYSVVDHHQKSEMRLRVMHNRK